MKSLITPEPTRRTPAPGWERFLLRAVHPTAGSQFTVILGPPPGRPIYVRRRRHADRPLH